MGTYRRRKDTTSNMSTQDLSYRAYQGRLPVASKYLDSKWDKIKYNIHRSRLTQVKSQVDHGIPYSMTLKFNTNLKKERLKNEQLETINKENQRLLSKMHKIDSQGRVSELLIPGAANRPPIYKFTVNSGPKRFSQFQTFHHKTEMDRVAKENIRLLQKITVNEPIYNHFELEKDFVKRHKTYLSNITAYPSQYKKKIVPKQEKSLFEELT